MLFRSTSSVLPSKSLKVYVVISEATTPLSIKVHPPAAPGVTIGKPDIGMAVYPYDGFVNIQ